MRRRQFIQGVAAGAAIGFVTGQGYEPVFYHEGLLGAAV